MSAPTLTLEFGAMSAPIHTQLAKQKLVADKEKVRAFEVDATAILRLAIRGYLPESQVKRCRQRLLKHLDKIVRTV